MSSTEHKELIDRMSLVQRRCREAGMPVMVVFEGMSAAGKGHMIHTLIEPMDPRGFRVRTSRDWTKEEKKYFYMRKFWLLTPEDGQIVVFDQNWYSKILLNWDKKGIIDRYANDFNTFEKELTDGGTVIIKVFLRISKKEQSNRLKKLASSADTAWHVSKQDTGQNKDYKKYSETAEEMIRTTDTPYAPWLQIDGDSGKESEKTLMEFIVPYLEQKLDERTKQQKELNEGLSFDEESQGLREPIPDILGAGNPNQTMTPQEYEKKYKELSGKLAKYHNVLYHRYISVIIVFEGWDAGGKGGAIKRLTNRLDPRGYDVHPVCAPNSYEKSHNYLYRFWQHLPKYGHIAIFDRSWYGRVMVERIEGFCSEDEWKRAYNEINDTEKMWVREGAIVLKFWMNIDKDEQERRFKERMEDPAKQWKITDEDWRNREKWDAYYDAVNEMLYRTSKRNAPWIVVEGNCKQYARIKVIESTLDAIKKRLAKERKH